MGKIKLLFFTPTGSCKYNQTPHRRKIIIMINQEREKSAIHILSDLDFTDKVSKYKNVPPEAITRTRFNDRTSNGLTRCILRWFKLKGNYAVRINTMGRRLKDTVVVDVIGRAHRQPGKWIPSTTRTGTADIHASITGRHASIEVKAGKDRMSPEQHQTKKDIERSGGYYFMAKDFESFYQWYNSIL